MSGYLKELDGYRVRRTRRGICVVEADYWAIKRPPGWAEKMRAEMGDRRWRREFCRDWTVGGDDSFYPEFAPETHIKRSAGLLPDVVYRGWDFGRRSPACVWLQYSPKSNRVWFMREVILSDADIYTLRDLVLYLSGQIPIPEHRPKAMKYLEKLVNEKDYAGEYMPNPPWFERDVQFIDWAGHEAVMDRSGILETEHQHKTYAEVLQAGGVQLQSHWVRVTARTVIMRQLLNLRKDGLPGAFFDPCCTVLIKAMSGALSYKRPTKDNPAPEEPAKTGKYDDIHDAATYPLANLVRIVEEGDEPKVEPLRPYVMRGQDYRTLPEDAPPEDVIDSYLIR